MVLLHQGFGLFCRGFPCFHRVDEVTADLLAVLIGQVATTLSARGRGYAREFLRWLAKFFNGLGKRAYLLALDVRVSFYEEIGFKIAGREIVLERVDVEKDSASKGMLEEK